MTTQETIKEISTLSGNGKTTDAIILLAQLYNRIDLVEILNNIKLDRILNDPKLELRSMPSNLFLLQFEILAELLELVEPDQDLYLALNSAFK